MEGQISAQSATERQGALVTPANILATVEMSLKI